VTIKNGWVGWENPMMKSKDIIRASSLDLHGAFVRRTDLSGASLRGANMIGADATNAVFRGADFEGALLRSAILKGADLTGAKNLTLEQLSSAIIDNHTALPTYIDREKLHLLTMEK
jgi:uncharacterized protein YjbI with pentapeptide repeats